MPEEVHMLSVKPASLIVKREVDALSAGSSLLLSKGVVDFQTQDFLHR